MLACKLLVELYSREVAQTALMNQTDVAGVNVLVIAVKAVAAPRCCTEDNSVGAIVSLLDVNLHAVAQGDELSAIDVVGNLLDLDFALELRHQRLCADLFGEGCNVFSIDLLQGRQHFLLCRANQSFLLWHEDEDSAIVFRELRDGLINHVQRNVGHNLVHHLMAPLDACCRNIIYKVTHISTHQRGVCALVASLVGCVDL